MVVSINAFVVIAAINYVRLRRIDNCTDLFVVWSGSFRGRGWVGKSTTTMSSAAIADVLKFTSVFYVFARDGERLQKHLSVQELFQLLQLQQQAAQTATAASGLGASISPSAVGGHTPTSGRNPNGPRRTPALVTKQVANQPPPPQMNNIHPSYQASPQQHQQMFYLNGVAGMNSLPQGMNVGMLSNGGAPVGAAPGAGGNGVSAEYMIKK